MTRDPRELPTTQIQPATSTQAQSSPDPFTLASGEDETPMVDADVAADLAGTAGRERYGEGPLLGAGGMGEVHAVLDRRIGRRVAKKSLLVRVDHGQARARFLREARVQGQLEHPAIVPVYDIDSDDDSRVYFTMKRVRGDTLERVLDHLGRGDPEYRERYSLRRLLSALHQVCLAVGYAHARGIAHRDLKPANIMLGHFGEVYVLDWGLAKWIEAPGAPHSQSMPDSAGMVENAASVTGGDGLFGTLRYMAPEQILSPGRPLDERVDVFALGAILFEILAGTPLREATRKDVIVREILAGTTRAPSAHVPDLPPELDALALAATDPDPEARLASARELADRLEHFLDGDRDLELRRQLATRHVEEAERELARGAAADRPRALREAIRALALDADSDDAQRAVVDCLAIDSDEVPEGARPGWAREIDRARTTAVRVAMVGLLSWLAVLPLVVFLGVRDWTLVTATAVFTLLAVGQTRRMVNKASFALGDTALLAGLSAVVIALSSCYLGPMVLAPTCAVSAAMLLALHTRREEHWPATLTIAAGAAVPFVLELAHIGAPAYRFEADHVVAWARAVELPRTATLLAMLYSTLSFVLLTAYAMGRVRDALRASQQRLFVQAWLLDQAFPRRSRS